MSRFDWFALAAVVLVTLVTAPMIGGAWEYLEFRTSVATDKALAVLGWFVTAYASIAIAVVFLRWSRGGRHGWVLHLLYLPCVLAAIRIGDSLMLSALKDPDFDATIGTPIMTGLILLCLAVGGYAVTVIARGMAGAVEAAKPD